MISAALAAITSRKWLMELILAAVLVAGVYLLCQHLIGVGVARERAAWQTKVREANLETARQRGLADAAEAAGKKEHDERTQYALDHPLRGSIDSLCRRSRGVPATAQTVSSNAGAGAPSAAIQPVLEGGVGSGSDPDQLGMLSVLASKCDGLSSQLKEWQARQ